MKPGSHSSPGEDAGSELNIERTRVIGLVTIGQSPRPDITTAIAAALGPEFTLPEAGALDGLTDQQLLALVAGDTSEPLVTRLENGETIIVDAVAITARLAQQAERLIDQGAELAVVLCTHRFPPGQFLSKVMQPVASMQATLAQALPTGSLTVVCPHQDQVDATRAQFNRPGLRLNVIFRDPYSGDGAETLANRIANHQPDLVYLDCFGFSANFAANLKDIMGIPVYCPAGLTAQLIRNSIASS